MKIESQKPKGDSVYKASSLLPLERLPLKCLGVVVCAVCGGEVTVLALAPAWINAVASGSTP